MSTSQPQRPGWPQRKMELTFLLGEAIARWGNVEHALAQTCASMLGTDFKTACAIFSNIINFKTQLDIVHSVAQIKLNGKQELLFWNSLKDYMQELSGDRNNIAHSPMVFHGPKPPGDAPDHEIDVLIGPSPILHMMDKAKRTIDQEELQELVLDFEECVQLLTGFFMHLGGQIKNDELFHKPIARRRPPRSERLAKSPPKQLPLLSASPE